MLAAVVVLAALGALDKGGDFGRRQGNSIVLSDMASENDQDTVHICFLVTPKESYGSNFGDFAAAARKVADNIRSTTSSSVLFHILTNVEYISTLQSEFQEDFYQVRH